MTIRPASAAALRQAARPSQGEKIDWPVALALPAYVYGGGSAVLSTLSGYADTHPYGGVTINPGRGIRFNPEWTRHFGEYSTLRQLQPIVAGIAAAVHGVRGALELHQGIQGGKARLKLAGALDLGLAAASALSMAAPGTGGALSLVLLAGRAVLDLHP
jgi:hypothetical protein